MEPSTRIMPSETGADARRPVPLYEHHIGILHSPRLGILWERSAGMPARGMPARQMAYKSFPGRACSYVVICAPFAPRPWTPSAELSSLWPDRVSIYQPACSLELANLARPWW